MNGKSLATALGLFALATLVGSGFLQSSFAAPGKTLSAAQRKPVGLTKGGIADARESGAPSRLVVMQPQSSVALLEQQATELGPHAADSTLSLTVGLKLRNVAKLKTFLKQVQNPTSPVYHHFLTPAQFTALYGPTEAQVEKVAAFLKAHGIKVEGVSPNRSLIHTEATTANYEHAFVIRLNDYRLNGRAFYSTSDRPKLPRAIAPLVTNILGLNHGVQMRPLSQLKAHYGGTLSPRGAPPPALGYFNPHQIAKAYGWPDITNPNNGAGVSIAILTAMTPGVDTNPNYHDFWESYGLPDHTINVFPVGGQIRNGGQIESALDIEWSGAMAPSATLNVYVAADASFSTFTDMYNQFVTDNNSQVMSTSWGASEAGNSYIDATNEQIFMQAAAQGISMFAASGDYGASDCAPAPGSCPPGPNNADYPSSSVYITAANGTELSISDTSGTYGNEHVWADTGGAVSQLFDKPDWQTGPGVPADVDMRMNSDMALNAGGLHPYLVLLTGPDGTGYYGIAGTSAVAPIFAGLFAIGVSQQPGGVSLGQSNSLIYNAVNANDSNYATDFRDITTGCNGFLPDGTTESCATTNWDHPTGWGSPKATSLLSHLGVHGPSGTLMGTVTDAASGGAPMGDAIVAATDGNFSVNRTTEEDGSYSLLLPVGDYTVSVKSFGYVTETASVSVVDGATTTQDFSLNPATSATISGKVTDGSGHAYGLYAEIKVNARGFGQVADVWTNLQNGTYAVDLPVGNDYTLDVASAFNGYNVSSATIALSSNTTQDFSLTVTNVCTAPGYAFGGQGGFSQDFNGTIFPPPGWSIVNRVADAATVWKLNSSWGVDNVTGGTGTSADADSDAALFGGSFDTSLVTPPIDVANILSSPILRYKANYAGLRGEALDLDISTDDGENWTTILNWTTDHGTIRGLPGEDVIVDLGPYLPATGSIRLRWRYYSPPGFTKGWYAQIDDLVIGECLPVPGGLIFGQVIDSNTGDGIVGAHVRDNQGTGVDTVANPADPNLPVGSYVFFAPSGERTLTVKTGYYSPATATVSMTNNGVIKKIFALKAGRFVTNADSFTLHLTVNDKKTEVFEVKNTGSGTAAFSILAANTLPSWETPAFGMRVPLRHLKGHFSMASSLWLQNHGNSHAPGARRSAGIPARDSAWVNTENMPVALGDNAGATDPSTGVVYSVGGFDGVTGHVTSIYAYDPKANSWALVGNTSVARGVAAVAFLNGKLYTTNGFSDAGNLNPTLDIYDPGTGFLTQGTPNPVPAAGGSASAVVNGEWYVVGGCDSGQCLSPVATVQVYHPVTDSWDSAPDYPHGVSFLMCGGIGGKLYCAGGSTTHEYADGYMYDPKNSSAGWTPIASIPVAVGGLWAAGYIASQGKLLVSGGVTGNKSVVTNEGYAYDPGSNTWSSLPYSNANVYRGASACGFYRMGGFAGPTVTAAAEVLPGYMACVKSVSIPWLTVAPTSGTLAPGASTEVRLTFDGRDQEAFTTSSASLQITGNTPYPAPIVPLTVTWDPQHVNLMLTGDSNPDLLPKGGNLTYTLTVENTPANNHGAATATTMVYKLPEGVSYIASSGDASCVAPPSGSSPTPSAATSEPPIGTLICDFGTIDPGTSKVETIAVNVDVAGMLTSHFSVTAREPNDSGESALDIKTTVAGTADLKLDASDITIPSNTTSTVHMEIANGGPDTAANVVLNITADSSATLKGATSGQGDCTLIPEKNALSCNLGKIASYANVDVSISVYGTHAGSASLIGLVATSSDDKNRGNDMATATVTITSGSDSGGGGALGWLALAVLLGLALTGVYARNRRMAGR